MFVSALAQKQRIPMFLARQNTLVLSLLFLGALLPSLPSAHFHSDPSSQAGNSPDLGRVTPPSQTHVGLRSGSGPISQTRATARYAVLLPFGFRRNTHLFFPWPDAHRWPSSSALRFKFLPEYGSPPQSQAQRKQQEILWTKESAPLGNETLRA